jgi:zinc protease
MDLPRPEIRRTEVDGVPVFYAPGPPPLRAMLMFRVGSADESLPTRGICHLVEHLALSPFHANDSLHDHFNGRVEPRLTRFWAHGTPEELCDFLARLTMGLAALPAGRLDDEKRVLRTEAENKGWGSIKSLASFRWGPHGQGLVDYEEFGLRWLSADAVQSWANEWFNSGNAAMWFSGPVPEGLRLHLAPGQRHVQEATPTLEMATPAIYQEGNKWVALSMLGSRGYALNAAAAILDRRVRVLIRHEQSISYDARVNYLPVDRDQAEVSAFADALAPNAAAAARSLIEAVLSLSRSGTTPEEISLATGDARRILDDPESVLADLERSANAELEGRPIPLLAEAQAGLAALNPEEVAESVRTAFPSALLAVPQEVPMAFEGFTPIPWSSGKRMSGRRVMPMPGAKHADEIDFSEEGISLTTPGRGTLGIRWAEVGAGLWWADGSRQLIGPEGAGFRVVPDRWRDVGPLLEAIQTHVPPDRWIPMDDPGDLPQEAGLRCQVCGAQPAHEVVLREHATFVVARLKTIRGVFCRDCGIARFRQAQRYMLAWAWWGFPGLVVGPMGIIPNVAEWNRLRKLPVPIRTSGVNPLRKPPPAWLHPMAIVLTAGIVALIGIGVAVYLSL